MSTMTGRIVSLAFGLYDDVDESWTDDGKTYVTVALDGSPRFVLGRPVTLTRSLDRDEIARAIAAHQWNLDAGEVEPWDSLDAREQENVIENYDARRSADAVIAHLLGGAS